MPPMANTTYVSTIDLSQLRAPSSANGSIAYIDCLFLCYSALTVTGLSTVNLSTCTGFQQALLFIQMGLGNVVRGATFTRLVRVVLKRRVLKTTVSWIMVLIRKQYFRRRCETIMREYQEKHRMRGVWNNIAKRSFRRTVSAVPGVKVEEPASPEEPIVAAGEGIVAAVVAGAGVGLSVGLGDKAFQDGALDPRISRNPLEVESLLVEKPTGKGVVADTHSFTSSPRSVVVSLQPVSPTSGHGNPGVRWDEQSSQVRTDRNHMRKRASASSLHSVRTWADDHTSSSVHDDDAEYSGFGPSKAERPRYGRVPGTD